MSLMGISALLSVRESLAYFICVAVCYPEIQNRLKGCATRPAGKIKGVSKYVQSARRTGHRATPPKLISGFGGGVTIVTESGKSNLHILDG